MWSYGVTIWEIFSYGKEPYEKRRAERVPSAIRQGLRLNRPDDCPTGCYQLMVRCWNAAPEKRPTFSEVVRFFEHQRSYSTNVVRDLALAFDAFNSTKKNKAASAARRPSHRSLPSTSDAQPSISVDQFGSRLAWAQSYSASTPVIPPTQRNLSGSHETAESDPRDRIQPPSRRTTVRLGRTHTVDTSPPTRPSPTFTKTDESPVHFWTVPEMPE